MSLRDQVIRLAHAKPELQAHLLPILAKAKGKRESRKTAGNRQWAKMFPARSYLNMFFAEKDIPLKTFNVRSPGGISHSIPNTVVVEHIAQTGRNERRQVEDMIRKIDFANGDVNRFLEHLAGAIAAGYEQ